MSKEVKKALIDLMSIVVTDIHENEVRIDKTKIINEYNESVRTVLNYIKELEEETNGYKNYIKRLDKLDTRDFIFKQAIRDKIEELKENKNECKDVLYGVENCIQVLEGLLESEE